jgi:hypothetical protein
MIEFLYGCKKTIMKVFGGHNCIQKRAGHFTYFNQDRSMEMVVDYDVHREYPLMGKGEDTWGTFKIL